MFELLTKRLQNDPGAAAPAPEKPDSLSRHRQVDQGAAPAPDNLLRRSHDDPDAAATVSNELGNELHRWKSTALALGLQLLVKDRAVRHFRTKYVVGKEEYIRLDRQLEEERAAKISLQQDAAHRRARQQAVKRRWMTVGLMAGLGLIAMAAGAPLTYQHLYGLGWESMRQRYWGFPASGCILGIALAAMATAPTEDTSIRVCSAVAVMAQVGNTFGFGVYAVMHFTGMHRPKYDAPAVGTIMAWLALFYSVASLVSVALFFSVFRVSRHDGISLSNVVRKTVSTFGRTAGIAVMLLLFPVVWAAAQPSSSFRIERLAAYRRLWTVTRGLFGTWGVGTTIAGCACVLVDAPWDTHPVVPSVLLLAAMELLLAAVGLSTPVRKRVQAWVSRVGAGSEMRAAAGVAALVGTLRPEKALALAKERFCALPFDVLRQADFNTNEDTGLNEKSVPMQLGQCDAFISHVRVAAFEPLHPLRSLRPLPARTDVSEY
jgi:hypothetical protein